MRQPVWVAAGPLPHGRGSAVLWWGRRFRLPRPLAGGISTRPFTATLWLTLLSSALLYPQVTPDKEKAVFEGSVRDSVSKLPIAKASIHVTPVAANQPTYAGISDATGAFRFEAITPGDYRILVRGRGYVDAHAIAIEAGRSANTVHFNAGKAVTGAVIELAPEAAITGRVTDADGEQMRAGGVVYPNAPSVEGGVPVDIHPGQQLSGIAFKLRAVATYHLRGSIKLYSPPAPRTVVTINRRNGDRTPGANNVANDVKKDGTFDFMGVPPGSYWLELMPLRGSPTGRIPVDVIDRDVNGIKLESIPQFDIKGRVRFEEDGVQQPLTAAKLHIDWLDWFLFPFSSVVSPAADGTFVFPTKPAGVYVITLAPETDLYIQSISYNRREAEDGRLDLTNGPSGEVEIVLGTGTGQVDGSVHWPDAVPGAPPPALPPGATAVLVSASGVTGNTGARGAEIDESGHFHFPFVPPGRYFAFVTPRFDEGLWQNMDFVQQIREGGVSVDVPKKGNVTAEVPILSNDDLQHAIEKVPR